MSRQPTDWVERAKATLAKECPKCHVAPGVFCVSAHGRIKRTFCRERTPSGKSEIYAEWAKPLGQPFY